MRTEKQGTIDLDQDRKLRGLHIAATRQLAPETLRRLREARQGLTSHSGDTALTGSWRWLAAGLGSVALAVAVGLQISPSTTGSSTSSIPLATTTIPAAPAPADALEYPASLAALDEDPDLYLWLAAEAGPLQLEQL